MPFFDNNGTDANKERGPLWAVFATLCDQIEYFVVLNIAWSVQLLPAITALGFPDMPLWVRLPLLLYSGAALAPATAMLYVMVSRAAGGENLSMELARETFRDHAWPSFRVLAPLLGVLASLVCATALLGSTGNAMLPGTLLHIALRLFLLLLLVCAMFWGPLLVEAPQSAFLLARRSALLLLRHPGKTLLLGMAVLLVALVGIISVGGLFLIVPVLVALLQTHMYRHIKQQTPMIGDEASVT